MSFQGETGPVLTAAPLTRERICPETSRLRPPACRAPPLSVPADLP
jgi:hypothetical protein